MVNTLILTFNAPKISDSLKIFKLSRLHSMYRILLSTKVSEAWSCYEKMLAQRGLS